MIEMLFEQSFSLTRSLVTSCSSGVDMWVSRDPWPWQRTLSARMKTPRYTAALALSMVLGALALERGLLRKSDRGCQLCRWLLFSLLLHWAARKLSRFILCLVTGSCSLVTSTPPSQTHFSPGVNLSLGQTITPRWQPGFRKRAHPAGHLYTSDSLHAKGRKFLISNFHFKLIIEDQTGLQAAHHQMLCLNGGLIFWLVQRYQKKDESERGVYEIGIFCK